MPGSRSSAARDGRQEQASALEPIVAREIDEGDGEHAARAAALLLAQIMREKRPLEAARVVEDARSRFFLAVDAAWDEVFDAMAAGRDAAPDLEDRLKKELRPRVGADMELRIYLSDRCRQLAPELCAGLSDDLREGRDRAQLKRAACAKVWRDVLGHFIERALSPGGAGRHAPSLPATRDQRAAAVLQLLQFAELVDLRHPDRVAAVVRATPPLGGQQHLSFNEEVDHGRRTNRRGRGPVKTRPVKPRKRLTPEQEARERARQEVAAQHIEDAVPRAMQALAGTVYGDVVHRLASGDASGVSSASRTRAYHRLSQAMHPYGFACGVQLDDPDAFIGARHVVPNGVAYDTSALPDRQAKAIELELQRRSLKEIARAMQCRWPDADAPDEDWAEVLGLLADLAEARRAVRGDHRVLYEGDPFSRVPRGFPTRFATARSAVRQAKSGGPATMFHYGCVLVLPDDAYRVEAKVKTSGKPAGARPLPSPLDKVHVGEWFFFPSGGLDA